MTGRCPGWLTLDAATRKFEIDEVKANIVRRIFADYMAGAGQLAIARALNIEECPTLSEERPARCWRGDFIHRLLRSPTVVGTLVPSTRVEQDGVSHRITLVPVPDYYPPILSLGAFQEAQKEMEARRLASLNSDKSVWNVVGRLARCPTCGSLMYLKTTSCDGRRVRYLTCERRSMSAGCPMIFARYDGVENALLNRTRDLRLAREVFVGVAASEKSHTKAVLDAAFRYETDPRLPIKPLLATYLPDFEFLTADPPYGSKHLKLALRRCVSAITIDPKANRLIVR